MAGDVHTLDDDEALLRQLLADWQKDDAKEDDVSVQARARKMLPVAQYLLQKLVPLAGERYLVDLELSKFGQDSEICQAFWRETDSQWIPGEDIKVVHTCA